MERQMTSTATAEWARRLQAGTLDLFDLKALEAVRIEDLIGELSAFYPVRFLDRSIGTKREIGLAQKSRVQKRSGIRQLTECLILTSEGTAITTLAAMTQLRCRPSRSKASTIELTTDPGFRLYHDPDGWRIKLLHERTVTLTEQALRKRGWLFDDLGANGSP
jgi:hypothetical protein